MPDATGIHDHPDLKLGRRPADPGRYAAVIELPLAGGLPPWPLAADHLAAISTWNLGGNNQFGTCGPTGASNLARLVYAATAGQNITCSDEQVFDLYRRSGNPDFDPATGAGDDGVDMTVMLGALLKGGLEVTHTGTNGQPDPQSAERIYPVCYARYPVTMPNVKATTWAAGGTLFGLDLQTAQQDQTGQVPPVWDYQPSPVWGGHCTMGGAYTGATSGADIEEVTWAQVVGVTDRFLAHQAAEAYVVVWPPLWHADAFAAGVDRAELAALYEHVTGKPIGSPR